MTPKAAAKRKISATVDTALADAGDAAVAAGTTESFSAWVNEALVRQVAHERRLTALAEFVEQYEAEHGVISAEEIAATTKRLRAKATTVRGRRTA